MREETKMTTAKAQKYEVLGLDIVKTEPYGGIIYDNLSSIQEAHDICTVLNAGIGPEWDEVEEALKRLVITKHLPEKQQRNAKLTKTLVKHNKRAKEGRA